MRSAAAALALGLLLIASGCGTSSAATQTSSGTDAASLVPASALAYVSADANLDSQQWQVLTDVFGPLPSKLDYKNDIHPALGDRVNLAVLGIDNGKPEAVALVQPTDEAKLSALAKKFDQGSEHYTVEQIGGWSVVADSAEAFQSVRNADSGSSLADTANFKSAMSQVGDAGFATVYASGSGVQQLPAKLQALVRVAGSPRWVAASITADKTALQIKARAAGGTSPAAYRPTLLRRRALGRDSRGLVQGCESAARTRPERAVAPDVAATVRHQPALRRRRGRALPPAGHADPGRHARGSSE